jgi:Membrane bound beta barrel domain (DUF5777)
VIRTSTRLALALAGVLFAAPLFAQDDDASLNIAQPDFTLVNLPTSLRLPSMRSAFRVTHRFVRPLKCDECEDNLLEDLFGIDNGAAIGLEFRFGLVPGGQVVFHRARVDKTIQLLGQYNLTRQGEGMPVEIAALAEIEGTDNFREDYSGAFGAILTRLMGDRGTVHLEPMFVVNSNLFDPDLDDDSTFMLGIGSRIRLAPTVYVVGEMTPRLSGYKPDAMLGSFAIEKRAGGHVFQLNFSNYFGTTMRQLAQGAPDGDHWYMGFNISRKFF